MRALRYWREYRSFRRLPVTDRQIVFYSESGQDWHHFEPVIAALTTTHDRVVCYVTSDPDDPGLVTGNPRIRGFCIGAGLTRIVFFQFLNAGVMVLTMIDLENLQLKRSIHRVHYIFMFHSLISTHMADFENSYDHYDSVLCAGPHQMREIRRREELAGLRRKHLVPHGYHRLERLMEERAARPPDPFNEPPHVLLAPSWGDDTILNTCGERLIAILLNAGFQVTLRPHYQTGLLTPGIIDALLTRFSDHPRFRFVDRMGEDDSLFDSDLMITEWSGAGMDYGMGLEKPVLYIDLPPKSRNDKWRELGLEPFESYARTRLGRIIKPEALADAPEAITELLRDPEGFSANVAALRSDWVFNLGRSAEAAAQAIVDLADQAAAGGADSNEGNPHNG